MPAYQLDIGVALVMLYRVPHVSQLIRITLNPLKEFALVINQQACQTRLSIIDLGSHQQIMQLPFRQGRYRFAAVSDGGELGLLQLARCTHGS